MQSTRKFEMGLPLFSGLDLGLILESQAKIRKGDFQGLTGLVETLGKTGALRTVRKLSAIWRASEVELKAAEATPSILAELEELAAARPFTETFKDAMDFQGTLWESLGVSPDSSAAAEPAKTAGGNPETSADSPSAG